MSYLEIITELTGQESLEQSLFHKMDKVILEQILSDIPHRHILMTQILFSLEQIQSLIKLTSQYHTDTGFHLGRVGRMGGLLARKAGVPWTIQVEALFGGWLHDIGKTFIDLDILEKPARLTKREFDEVKKHVQFGMDMLTDYPHLQLYSQPVFYHHEQYAGGGYPCGLIGEQIPLSARIISIVDAYDAMTNTRPYCPTKTHREAMLEIKRCAGIHFDPELAKIFISKFSQRDIESLT